MLTSALAFTLLLSPGAASMGGGSGELLTTEVIADETRNLPNLGITLRDVRSFDPVTGRIVRVTTNAATGEEIDGDRLLREEGLERDRISGKISHELTAILSDARGTVPVVFWLDHDEERPDLRVLLDSKTARGTGAKEARIAAAQVAERFTARVTDPFVALLESDGHTVHYADGLAPIVFVDLTADEIRRYAARGEVDQVYYSFPKWESEGPPVTAFYTPNEFASPSARTDAVHRRGVTGAGANVMVNDVGAVTTSHSALPPVVTGRPGGVSSHATAVAGIISSSDGQHTGAAPGLTQIYDYFGTGDIDAPKAWAWGIMQGISFGNCSWWNFNKGSIVFLDRYFDYIIRNFAVMMFKSCGNQGNGDFTTTPCNGFNMTATGNASENNTWDWDDDFMSSGSSTRNPQPSDHEKPEVASFGSSIVTTNTGGGFSNQGSGTSYASPVTCGTAALLAETDPVLAAKPEAVKAILMAGAWNNIHGAAPLSDYDGAGGIHAAASQSLVENGQYVTDTLTTSSFPGGVWSQTMHLDAGNETRIVGLWFSKADDAFITDVLQMDLDMIVRAPDGSVATTSASTKNPFEIVSFVPTQSGMHTVEMQMQRFDGTTEPFALAWSTTFDYATNLVTQGGSTKIGEVVTLEWFDRYHPGSAYVGLLSITPYPATVSVPNAKLLPVGSDPILSLSLTLPGFMGNYDGTGRATAAVPVPNLPGIVGLTVYTAVVTLQSGGAEAEELSRTTSFVITN